MRIGNAVGIDAVFFEIHSIGFYSAAILAIDAAEFALKLAINGSVF